MRLRPLQQAILARGVHMRAARPSLRNVRVRGVLLWQSRLIPNRGARMIFTRVYIRVVCARAPALSSTLPHLADLVVARL